MKIVQVVPRLGRVWCLLMLGAVAAAAQQPAASRRVLLLHEWAVGEPVRAKFDAAFVEGMRSADAARVDLYEETIETLHFPGPDQTQLLQDYLKRKYAGLTMDVIVAQGMHPLNFARQNRALFGNPPIVAVASPAGHIPVNSGDITGLQGGQCITGTIELAQSLLPDTDSVYVVDGARENAEELQPEVERQVKNLGRRVDLVYLRDLPLAELLPRIAAAPPRAIVLFIRQTMRTRSQAVDQFEALAEVVRASHVPVFSPIEDFVGRGILGGFVWSYEADAGRMAAMATSIAHGASVRDTPPGQSTYATILDWRELQRWRIPEERIPAGSVVRFRRQSFFEQYRRFAIGGLLIFTAQLALIVGLVAQRVRRRRAEEKLRTNEERYRSVVDTQTELICRFLPDSTLTFVNDAYCRFWGKTRDELVGRKFIELIPEAERGAVLERIGRLLDGLDSHEHQVMMPDGSIGWQHWINHAIATDPNGVIEFQGVGRDITDRRRAEEALGQAEARNSALLRAIPDLMFVLSGDGRFVDYHARDPKLLFVPPSVFIGKTIRDVMPPDLAQTFMEALEEATRSDDTVVVEYELPLETSRHFEARVVRAGTDRAVIIVRDVTEAMRASELNRDLAGKLIASQEDERHRIARELHDDVSQKIALLAIGIDQLAATFPAEQSRFRELSDRTGEIATDIHDLSHELHPSKLQTLGLVDSLQLLCRDVARQGTVDVVFKRDVVPQTVEPNVALCLYRIAQEALHNVVRHSSARHAEVRLAGDAEHLVLQVSDSGVGFDAKRGRWEGLGLASMRERAAFLKGQLVVHTFPGGGTRIGVRVPIAAPVRTSSAVSKTA
jgi:PAS domain S-box-containing protein